MNLRRDRRRNRRVMGKLRFLGGGFRMRRFVSILLCLALVLTLSSGCGRREETTGKELYVPILADASWLTQDGSFLNGVQLAVQDLNREYSGKGFSFKTAVLDDQDQYEKGVENAGKAANNKAVTAVFNLQNFDVSKTTADILTKSGKLVVFPYGAYDSLFSKENPLVFCGVPSFSDLGTAMANYAVLNGFKRIAIYHNGNQSQEELVTAFETALLNTGVKVVDYVPSIASERDFEQDYNRWKALSVDSVVISQYGLEQAFKVLEMIRNKDKNLAIIGEPIFNASSVLTQKKEIAEGMVIPSTLNIEESEKLAAFRIRYKQKYGRDADVWAVQGYDMMRLMGDTAVRINSSDPAEIAAELHNTRGYEGVGQHIAFASGGALKVDVSKLPMLVCRDGSFREMALKR